MPMDHPLLTAATAESGLVEDTLLDAFMKRMPLAIGPTEDLVDIVQSIGSVPLAIVHSATGNVYFYDEADTTTADDGITCLVDGNGHRYKVQESTAVSVTSVISKTATPPGSPSIGDAYVVDVAPTGAWAAHAKDIAVWTTRGWVFATPQVGTTVLDKNTDLNIQYSEAGSWGAFAVGGSFASTTEVLTGTDTAKATTSDAIAALWEKGSNVASAGTVSLGEGGYFHITGTTTITDIDFGTAKNGRSAWVIFDGALTLTHNATTLQLPGGVNITTAAGDRAHFTQDSGDNIICDVYVKANGTSVVSSGLTLDTEKTTTSGTTKDFTIPAGAKLIYVMLNGVSISTAAVIGIQLGDAGGIESSGYTDRLLFYKNATAVWSAGGSSSQFDVSTGDTPADTVSGTLTFTRMNGTHTWMVTGTIQQTSTTGTGFIVGNKTLSQELTTIRLTGGTFDAGAVNVSYQL